MIESALIGTIFQPKYKEVPDIEVIFFWNCDIVAYFVLELLCKLVILFGEPFIRILSWHF